MTTSLTGVWDGTFIQPGVGAITFLATLIETGSALAGSVTEPCMKSGLSDSHAQRLDRRLPIRQRGLVRQALRAAGLRLHPRLL